MKRDRTRTEQVPAASNNTRAIDGSRSRHPAITAS